MEVIASASLTSAFGNGFLAEFIRDTYSFVKDSSRFPQVQETILLLDLKNFIPLTHNLVNYLETQDLAIHIELAVDQLKNSIILIRDQLAFIQNTLITHRNKFLHAFRPPKLGKHLNKLTILKSNADKQLNYILHLLPPHHEINKKSISKLQTDYPSSCFDHRGYIPASQKLQTDLNTKSPQYQNIQELEVSISDTVKEDTGDGIKDDREDNIKEKHEEGDESLGPLGVAYL